MSRAYDQFLQSGADTMPDENDIPVLVRKRPSSAGARRAVLPKNMQAEIAKFARAAREATQLDLVTFADRVGITPQTLTAIESGKKSSVSLPLLSRMAKVAGKRLALRLDT